MNDALPRKGEVLTVRLTELDDEGLAVARLDWPIHGATRRLKLVARGGLPGDLAEVRVESRLRDTLHGRVLALVEPAQGRVEPTCRHARFSLDGRHCGGCTLQALAYPDQLALKRARVVKALDVGGVKVAVADTIAAPRTFGHRHKMELSFTSERLSSSGEPGPTSLGLHPPGLKWEVVALEECPLLSPEMSAFLPRLAAIFQRSGLYAWDPRDELGLLRNLVIREGRRTPDRLLEIVTTTLDPAPTRSGLRSAEAAMNALKVEILAEADISKVEISSLLWTIQDAARGRPTIYRTVALHGRVTMGEVLRVPSPAGERDLSFEIDPRAFFQPHPLAAEVLVREVYRRLPPGCRTILDLYCGTGTLGITLAPSADNVLGIELVPEAVAAARDNAGRNGLDQAEFIAGDVAVELARLRQERPERLAEVDVALLDPPRSGLSPQALEVLLAQRPPRLVYVSCKPESLARDLRLLIAAGYMVEGEATPVDLFPHSHHVETVVSLVAT